MQGAHGVAVVDRAEPSAKPIAPNLSTLSSFPVAGNLRYCVKGPGRVAMEQERETQIIM